jgi:hypothetical protein
MPQPCRAFVGVVLAIATMAVTPSLATAALKVDDLGDGAPTATQLAQALAGVGVTIANATYVGAPTAAGTFTGGTGIIGFETGVVMGSGAVAQVAGSNSVRNVTTEYTTPGDPELDALVGGTTHDAAVLAFDVVPTQSTLVFRYVFSSDEYNEFVREGVTNSWNDVFAFFVNGKNCAVVPGTSEPVSVNTINGGKTAGARSPQVVAKHPELFRNNDVGASTIDTEMDGLTIVLTCTATVTTGQPNHVKLAIADRLDRSVDSNVFLERFVAAPPGPETVISGGPGATIPGSTARFTFSANDPAATFECHVDSGPFVPCASPHTAAGLTTGPHAFEVRAVNAQGVRGPAASRSFVVGAPTRASSTGPTLGKTVAARVVSGQVFVRLPGRTSFSPLQATDVLPVGTVVDARRGRVALTSAAGRSRGRTRTQRGQFYDGLFQIRQQRARRPFTDIALQSPGFRGVCGSGPRAARAFDAQRRLPDIVASAARKRSKKVVSRLWANAKGRYRTRGHNSTGTVRGTVWLTEERCDGTLTRVTRGVVSVRNRSTGRTVIVRAGRSYLARRR